ncbi:MAG: primosomal protein N', partial [Solirubrobacterales bacterium]
GTPAELVRLGLWVGREYCSTPSRGLQLMLPPGTGAAGERVRPRMEMRFRITEGGGQALADGARLGERQRAALEALRGGELSGAELAAAAGAERDTLRRLEHRGLLESRTSRVVRRPSHLAVEAVRARVDLNPDQRRAVAEITAALDSAEREPRRILLHGVTGSGKTEVYLAAVEAALGRGRGAIVLVPEIGLTPLAVGRFRARLGDRFAVLHSGLAPGQRYDEWQRLRSGEASVCVGPRSAIFAPVRDLGLIVVDEEHDPSYKQEGDPAYDARTVAERRAADSGALVVSGSATPRPESWLDLPRIDLPSRADGSPLPSVDVVDMRESGSRAGPLHSETLEGLEKVRREGGKAIVLINRRGFAPWLTCRSCGHHWGCPNCDVSLITHRAASRLVCHHCAHSEPLPGHCSQCGSTTIARAGAGTERIEELLAKRLDPLAVMRLDSDSASEQGAHGRILARFADADGAVLVGTQMVGKGHDFPEVTLSVILDADATLRFPDFRAEERTFALVAQLAGRSGRGAAGGRVIVQTMAPEAASIAHAACHDAPGFLAGELDRRRMLRYPPFSHLVRVGLASERPDSLEQAAEFLRAGLETALPAGADLLGPAPMFRVRNRHRRRLLVKADERGPAVDAVRGIVERAVADRRLRDVALGVDVDPQ